MPTTKKVKTVSKLNPIRKHKLQNRKSNPSSLKVTHTRHKKKTFMESMREVKQYLKFFGTKITVSTALKYSLKVDIDRARTQLRAFYLTGIKTGIFRFRVKSSGLYKEDSHEVDIYWDTKNLIGKTTAEDIFRNAPIKAQCSCGRHTYWYRYIWTKAGSSLGVQENRFPSVRNANLNGICCKHTIKVLETISKPQFQATFKRYILNLESGKRTNASHKDKIMIASSSFGTTK